MVRERERGKTRRSVYSFYPQKSEHDDNEKKISINRERQREREGEVALFLKFTLASHLTIISS